MGGGTGGSFHIGGSNLKMDVNDRAKKEIEDIFGLLNGVDADSIKSEGITIRAGNKLLRFEVVSEEPLTIEDEIRNELKSKLRERIQVIREKVNEKITEMSNFIQERKREYDRKESDLKDRLARATPMPEVTEDHARRGLSVVKGNGAGRLVWLVQGVYWPKYLDKKPLRKIFSKKLLSNIIYKIETKDDLILKVSTRQPIGLDYFSHYHQSKPDCWGNWKPKRKWKTPMDIIKCAREAEAVLENINTASIATRNPSGMPRRDTVLRHVVKDGETEKDKLGSLNQATRRAGITPNLRDEDEDIWMAQD